MRLNVPPVMKSNSQMAAEDVILTKKFAHLRIHVERAIGRIKEYYILQSVLPAAMLDIINQVVFVCCMLSNFNPPFSANQMIISNSKGVNNRHIQYGLAFL